MRVYDAVVLAGGGARRLGGIDKPALEIDGTTLLDRAIAAARGAERVVVVGERRPTSFPVEWTVEEPRRGGPVAALAAGLARVRSPRVLVLAADLPYIDTDVVQQLLASDEGDAVAVDDDGRRQPLLAIYDVGSLRDALGATATRGRAMRDLLEQLDPVEVPVGPAAIDCDTWEDVERAMAQVSRSA